MMRTNDRRRAMRGAKSEATSVAAWAVAILSVMSAVFSTSLYAGPPVAPTEALTPAEQLKKFKLPPGFEIQLVAAEPEIQKPMNLSFDARGRLWVTHSVEYPFAAAPGTTPRDGVTVLGGIGADGRATKVERFADELNIPIGVLPLGAGREVILWSIPNIWKLTDVDGDGRADKREILYGPFDIADTHGNQNAFRLMPDGWIYACHGFRNNSQIKLKGEGDVVLTLQSGNTYRFRPDGSAIEQVSWGQVNPFGMCFDRWGNQFTADCHSKPITMLLRGGYYESFGKPHDGLGFAPVTTRHDHDSTGIAGVAYYDATNWPAEYRHCFYVGNVITNVVHRDVVQWRGSSPWVEKPVDFVVCDDPWFHPVDLQVGPDGALYISDFYNAIIGHYEVDLKHPRRDRTRGRIWRVVYRGENGKSAPPPGPVDFTQASEKELVSWMGAENIAVRAAATRQAIERPAATALAIGMSKTSEASPLLKAQAVWLAASRGELDAAIASEKTQPSDPLVRVQLCRAVGELSTAAPPTLAWLVEQLKDGDPFVKRAAADALSRHPRGEHVAPLLEAWQAAEPADEQLVHTLKLAVRRQLTAPGGLAALASHREALPAAQLKSFLEVGLAVPTAEAADFLFAQASETAAETGLLESSATHVARYSTARQLDAVATFTSKKFGQDLGRQASLLRAVQTGLRQRKTELAIEPGPARDWALALAAQLLDPKKQPSPPWANQPLDASVSAKPSPSPWGVRIRKCADGQDAQVFDSIVGGESLTGVLRSAPFLIPAQLTFWLCGHNGSPDKNPPPVNHIRLRLVDSGEIVAKQIPPRNDTAQKIVWDLKESAGRRGVIEIVDADSGTAYAWIGAGRFEPAVVAAPSAGFGADFNAFDVALQVVEAFKSKEHLPAVDRLIGDGQVSGAVRSQALQTEFAVDRAAVLPRLPELLNSAAEPAVLRAKAAELLAALQTDESRKQLAAAIATVPSALQNSIALSLASTTDGAEVLLATIAAGKASPRLLQDKPILDRLASVSLKDREQRVAELTKSLPPADERAKQLITQRLQGYAVAEKSLEQGAAAFKKNCAVCHKAKGEGAMIGPQLDGIASRGVERLIEDIVDPNRNVDAAFRTLIVTTTGGQVITGLKLREEGQTLVLADNQGKEVRVPMSEIEEQRQSSLSLMPANLVDTLPEADFYHVLTYLSQLRSSSAPK